MVFCVSIVVGFFFVKQKTAYEMRISDWSSDVGSSDLQHRKDHQRDQKLNQREAVPSHSAARIKLSMADDAPSRPATVISTCNNRASSVARTSRVQRHVRPPFSISPTSLPIEGGAGSV